MDQDLSYLGTRWQWDDEVPFGLSAADRRQHVYIVGKTGTGKSTLLRNLIVQDIHHGLGVGLVDPHGDLAEDVLDAIPSWRSDDVIYFNPSDYDHPIALNLLEGVGDGQKHLVTSGIVSSFRSIWKDSWGPRMEYVLYACIASLLECQDVSLLGVQRMLVDVRYREWVIRQIKDPILRAYWLGEFAGYDRRLLAEIISPIQNKVGQLFMTPAIRNILGQTRRNVDMRFAMDKGRVFIANLAKGKMGADQADLLGSLLVTQFQLAAMSRSGVPEAERRPFHLYVDEFHNFGTDSFASILSEARKYGLALHLSHQFTSQLPTEVRDAVLGNAGTLISFRVGDTDAQILEREFSRTFRAHQFSSLANHTAYVRALINGEPMEPFQIRTLPPIPLSHRRRDALVELSRRKYASKRSDVEAKIERWIGRGRHLGKQKGAGRNDGLRNRG